MYQDAAQDCSQGENNTESVCVCVCVCVRGVGVRVNLGRARRMTEEIEKNIGGSRGMKRF